jgi:predicted transcriptional regulator
MSGSIGKALASAIKDPATTGQENTGRHIFQSQHRRAIFSMLTLTPCIGTVHLARLSGIAPNTVKWHLDKLLKAGYLVKHSEGRHSFYFPEGLISHGEVMLFATLNDPRTGMVYRGILGSPGTSQSSLAAETGESRQAISRILDRLESQGLLTAVIDGAYTRYYPTKLLPESAENFYRHSKEFLEYIIRRVGLEGGKPPAIVKKALDRVMVEMGHAQGRFAMEIGINPFMTCNMCQF